MKFAVKESLLVGNTPSEKITHAKELGFEGVELDANDTLVTQIPETVRTLQTHGLKISAVNLGSTQLLHPEFATRDRSIQRIRTFMSQSIDLGAEAIVFLPFYSATPVLPDLHPYKSAQELEAELLITQLRTTLCDLAYALGCHMHLQIANSAQTHLIRKVSHAEKIRNKLKNHPHLHIAAHTYHIDQETDPIAPTLADFREGIGYIYLSDSGHTLPGEGTLNFVEILNTLDQIQYNGWLVLDADASALKDTGMQLKRSLDLLKQYAREASTLEIKNPAKS